MEPSGAPLRFHTMRGSIHVIAVLSLGLLLATPCPAQRDSAATFDSTRRSGPTLIEAGTVTSLDSAEMSIVCKVGRVSRRYWVTRATHFTTGRHDASFFGLSAGDRVEVVSHASGGSEIADDVRF